MAITVKLVYPDNLAGAFLRGEYYNGGESYSSQLQTDDPTLYANSGDTLYDKNELLFNFQIEDSDTRDVIPLQSVTSLKISNDPSFAPESTITFPQLPATGNYNPAYLYQWVIDFGYFAGTSGSPILSSTVITSPDPSLAGYFQVTNWPLSANGGLSTVYIQAIVQSTVSAEQISFANGYNIYDQVFWQSERPSTPGTPQPILPLATANYCGRDTLWRFRASEESATGRYSSGVSRYLADVIESRISSVTTTRVGAMKRTIAPGATENVVSTACFQFSSETSGTTSTNVAAGSAMPVTSSLGKLSSPSTTVSTTSTAPDLSAQAFVRLDFSGNYNANGKLYICIFQGGTTPWASSVEAYWAVIESLGPAKAQARLYSTTSGSLSPNITKTILLQPYVAELINSASGGLMEMYVSTRSTDGFSIVSAYFTPDGSTDSIPIGSALMPMMTNPSSYSSAAGAWADSNANLYVDEVAMSIGRMLLGVDIGDGFQDDANSSENPALEVGPNIQGFGGLSQAILDGSVIINTRGSTSTATDTNGLSMFSTQDSNPSLRAVYEYMSATPTFSSRSLVRWTSATQRGEFYVAISPHAPSNGATLIERCDPRYDGGNQPDLHPTVAVVFSSALQKIYLAARLSNGYLRVREWMPWYNITPTPTSDVPTVQGSASTWSIQISNDAPTGLMPGTYISLWMGEDPVGSHRLDGPLMSADNGVGYYVAAGVRAYASSENIDSSIQNGSSRLDQLTVRGLAPIQRDGDKDPINQRHFRKCNGSPAVHKPLLGQSLVSGITDAGPFSISAPATTTEVLKCNAVAISSISTTSTSQLNQAPLFVDGIQLYSGMTVLCTAQTDPTQNGLYQVITPGTGTDGVWSVAQPSWNAFDYVKCMPLTEIALVFTGTPAASGLTVINMPNTVDGVSVQNNQLIMVSSSAATGGIYSVTTVGTGSNGVWTRVAWLDTDVAFETSTLYRITYGTTYQNAIFQLAPTTLAGGKLFTQIYGGPRLDGTYRYTAQGGTAFSDPILWTSTTYSQYFTTSGVGPFISSTVNLNLIEIKAQTSRLVDNLQDKVRLRIHPYSSTDQGPEQAAMSAWVGSLENEPLILKPNANAPHTSLCQYDLSDYKVLVQEGGTYWLSISLPPGVELCEGNSKYQGLYSLVSQGSVTSTFTAKSIWHKAFISSKPRHRNVYDGGRLQLRAIADSHARYSSYASPLSSECIADIVAPAYTGTNIPLVAFSSRPTVRTATLTIQASDSESGVFSFRIAKETDRGDVVFGPWLPFKDFIGYVDLIPCKYAFDCANASYLTGAFTIDGVSSSSMTDGDRILVFSSSSSYAAQTYCGIYSLNKEGAWTRTLDFPTGGDITPNWRAVTQQGTTHGGTTWYPTLPAPAATPPYYDIGTTAFNWSTTPQAQIVEYTCYLSGTYPLHADGTQDTILMSQNQGFDGMRRIWAQVMDAAGNISESKVIIAPAQSIALVDTTPPDGSAVFVSNLTGDPMSLSNTPLNMLRLDGTDRVSDVKDFRWRQIGSGVQDTWSAWKPFFEYYKVNIASIIPNDGTTIFDGVRRVEVQFRDYGNNIIRKSPQWDILVPADDNILLNCSNVWQSPLDLEAAVYSGGVSSESYTNFNLIDSGSSFYGSGKAFYPVSSTTGSVGRTVAVRTSDYIVVRHNGSPLVRITAVPGANPFAGAAPNTFFIDAERGLIVLNTQPQAGDTLNADIVRRSAVVYRFDGRLRTIVADLGYLGDRIVLSILGTPNGLFIGTDQGNVYCFDGYSVGGPYLTAASASSTPLPVTCLHVMHFPYEMDGLFIYAGTAIQPNLFRALLSNANTSGGWSQVGLSFPQLGSTSGNITSLCASLGRLFIGTLEGNIYRYRRYMDPTGAEIETLDITALTDAQIGDNPNLMPVSSLLASGGVVFAGIANKPEVWSYTATYEENPQSSEQWTVQLFDRWWMNDPAPWQYYTSTALGGLSGVVDGNTFSRSDSVASSATNQPNIRWYAISDPDSETGFKELITLSGDQGYSTVVVAASGSDWEQSTSNATVYSIELEAQRLSGSGSQGMMICDGRYAWSLILNDSAVTISNGYVAITASLMPPDTGSFSALSVLRRDYGGAEYAKRGIRRLWNFAAIEGGTDNPYDNEDKGPMWPGSDPNGPTDTQGWAADQYVVPATNNAAGVVITPSSDSATEDTASFEEQTRILRITPTLNGSPRIVLSGISPNLYVDSQTKLLMRVRFIATDLISLSESNIGVAWASSAASDQGPENFVYQAVKGVDDFHLYEFHPSWRGELLALWIEVDGIKSQHDNGFSILSDTTDLMIDIDFICVAADEPNTSFTNNLTPVRVGVNDQDVTVWVGFALDPLIVAPDFLNLPTDSSEIHIGKYDTDQPSSKWGYSGVKWTIGNVVPPITQTEYDFNLQWRFPSTGGVTQLIHYQGAATALTQGITEIRMYDNPDDRAAKGFSYNAALQVWQDLQPPMPRLNNGYGIVKVLSATEYRSALVISGQSDTISFI